MIKINLINCGDPSKHINDVECKISNNGLKTIYSNIFLKDVAEFNLVFGGRYCVDVEDVEINTIVKCELIKHTRSSNDIIFPEIVLKQI